MKMKRFFTVSFSVLLMATLSLSAFAESLVAYFPFDGDVKDASGNGNHGEITGGSKWVKGIFGDAIELAPDAYVEMQASDSLHGDFFKVDPFTISAWIHPNFEGSRWQHIWRSLPIGAGHNTLFINKNQRLISWRGFVNGRWSWGDLCETNPGVFEADTWVHVAVTNDGDKFRIYVGGEKAAETDFQQTDGGNTTYRIGSQHIVGEAFAGLIDDYAVFTRTLDEDEINLIMNSGVAQFLQETHAETSPKDMRLRKISGDAYISNENQSPSFVVEVQDTAGNSLSGVLVKFQIQNSSAPIFCRGFVLAGFRWKSCWKVRSVLIKYLLTMSDLPNRVYL